MVGQTVSHYRILSQLGSGGMGVVYSAEHVLLGRPVAIKFVSADLAGDSHALERFRVEARAASALNHANICTIHDFGEYEGRPFIVMELMKGQTLRDRLDSGPLKITQVIDMGIQIADALDAAHSQGIVHRDIKPGNLFLTERGQVKILDFGVAKLVPRPGSKDTTDTPFGSGQSTAFGATVGTVWYMSPEQATGEKLDGRSDLFSLGIVLYECVTGHPPFVGKTAAVVLSSILNRTPTSPRMFNPEIPPRLEEVISNCLEKDRELRYQAAADLRADLKRLKRDLETGQSAVAKPSGTSAVAGSGSVLEVRPGPSEHVALQPRGTVSRRTMGLVAGGFVILAGGAGYFLWPRAAPPTPAGANTTLVGELSEALVQSRLELAAASLDARNYRAAATAAEEVLRAAPDHAEATRIRNEAQAMLARLDASVAEARQLLASGNGEGAARALDAARAIDPNAAGIAEVAAQLVNHYKSQASAAREGEQRARAAQQRTPVEAPPAPRPPAPAPAATPSSPPVQQASSPAAPASQPTPAPPAEPPAPATTAQPRVVAPPAPSEPVRQPEPPPAAPAPSAPSERREAPASPSAADDESAIRRVVATYARAIETKDLALFRSVKPNMSREEQQRISEGFRVITSQQVDITILSVERRGDGAVVHLRRRDTVRAGGRQQTTESQQTMTFTRAGNGWVIAEIGR